MTPTPNANESPDWDALARARAGESSDDEARAIEAWLVANPDEARLLDALDEAIADNVRLNSAEPDVESALSRVHARMASAPVPEQRVPGSAARQRPRVGAPAMLPRRRWMAGGLAAAAAVAAIAFGLSRGEQGDPHNGSRFPQAGAPGTSLTTAVGARDSVRLADGTRAILGPSSRIIVPSSFGRGSREVTVEGEVWLSVHHDESQPFTVRAGQAVVRDIGTEFTVRTDQLDDGPRVSVLVTEGVVSVRSASSTADLTLAAGDRGEVHADGQLVAQRGIVTDQDVAWTRGSLRYREAPLAVVRSDLRRWYGLELRIEDSSLVERRITASFDGQSGDEVVRTIALALGAELERTGSVAILRRAGTKRR